MRTHNGLKGLHLDDHLGSKAEPQGCVPQAKIVRTAGKYKAFERWDCQRKLGQAVALEAMETAGTPAMVLVPPAPTALETEPTHLHRRPSLDSPAHSLYFLRRPTISAVPSGASALWPDRAGRGHVLPSRGAFLTACRIRLAFQVYAFLVLRLLPTVIPDPTIPRIRVADAASPTRLVADYG